MTATDRPSAPAVAVVDADSPGNVGTIARAMKNFGFSDLKLVDPPPLDPDGEAYGFAGQAREDVLPNHDVVSFDHLVENYYTVGTTATTNEDDRKHVRYPFATPDELANELAVVESPVALVFGRERIGLTNEELERLDRICSIPASAGYPVLNLGQAATIVCYELRDLTVEETQHPDAITRADEAEIKRLYERFDEFLAASEYPDEKRPKTGRLFRRLIGRTHPTGREVQTLLGVFRYGLERGDDRD